MNKKTDGFFPLKDDGLIIAYLLFDFSIVNTEKAREFWDALKYFEEQFNWLKKKMNLIEEMKAKGIIKEKKYIQKIKKTLVEIKKLDLDLSKFVKGGVARLFKLRSRIVRYNKLTTSGMVDELSSALKIKREAYNGTIDELNEVSDYIIDSRNLLFKEYLDTVDAIYKKLMIEYRLNRLTIDDNNDSIGQKKTSSQNKSAFAQLIYWKESEKQLKQDLKTLRNKHYIHFKELQNVLSLKEKPVIICSAPAVTVVSLFLAWASIGSIEIDKSSDQNSEYRDANRIVLSFIHMEGRKRKQFKKATITQNFYRYYASINNGDSKQNIFNTKHFEEFQEILG